MTLTGTLILVHDNHFLILVTGLPMKPPTPLYYALKVRVLCIPIFKGMIGRI